jgi:ABC-2 type transport system permease protein
VPGYCPPTHLKTTPLLLLARVNVFQIWRRLQAVRGQSKLLTGVIGLSIVAYLVVSFWIFYYGLSRLGKFMVVGSILTERLLYLLFAFLFVLLLLSNLVIGYTNFFRNRETSFLLSLPVPTRTVFQWKFIESVLLASWAFLFLIAPLLAAFGLARGLPWHFYVVTVVLTGMFIVLPGVAGAWLAIHIARYLDRRNFQVLIALLLMGLVAAAVFWWRTKPATDEMLETRTLEVMDQMLVKTRGTMFPFLPSYWLTTSVLHWAEGALAAAGFFMLVLLSYTLFFGGLAFTRFGNVFYETASVVQSRASVWRDWGWFRRRQRRAAATPVRTEGLFERLARGLFWLRTDTRALVVKDFRMFWRDTTQWGQSVMLFGLLGVYIINLRNFTHQLTSAYWINLVSYLNLAACALNLATVTTRFVFPQFSLEGRRLWIVGMAPMGLAKVVKTKYWQASALSLVVTLSLITLSSYLLRMTWDRVAFFSGVVTVMTFTLNGLAVGLGVLYPNFKDANPSKIVSGFGGTLCLVLSFIYILSSVLLLGYGTTGLHAKEAWIFGSVAGFVLLSFVIGWLPFRLGLRQLKHFEV